jgi:hypothetical protein
MGGTDKIIIDTRNSRSVVPYLSLDMLQKKKE